MRKILLIPLDYYKHIEHPELFSDLITAFNKKTETKIYTTQDEAINFSPDVILFQGSLSVGDLAELKEHTKAKVAMWTGDFRYAPTQSLMDYKQVADLYLLPFCGEQLLIYENILAKPCYFLWEYIQDWRFIEPKTLESGDVVFVGNCYEAFGNDRVELIDFLAKHVPGFKAYGSCPQTNGMINYKDVPNLYNNSYLVIAENNWHDVNGYFTPRNLAAMSAGSCCMHHYFPGIEKYFENFVDSVIYKHKYELLDQINFLKANPQVSNAIAKKGHEVAKVKYKTDIWVDCFLKIVTNTQIIL